MAFAPSPDTSPDLPILTHIEYALFETPTPKEIQAAEAAWSEFQRRWLRAYGTRTVSAKKLLDLADGLFYVWRGYTDAGRLNAFSKFLGNLHESRMTFNGWGLDRTNAGYSLKAV